MDNQGSRQAIVVTAAWDPNEMPEYLALFDDSGAPITILTAAETGADVVLTGFVPDEEAMLPITSSDTVNEALAKLQAVAVPDGTDILLTGLVAGTAAAVAASDSVNEAIAKLQAQIDAIVIAG